MCPLLFFSSPWSLWFHFAVLLIAFPQLCQTRQTLHSVLTWPCCPLPPKCRKLLPSVAFPHLQRGRTCICKCCALYLWHRLTATLLHASQTKRPGPSLRGAQEGCIRACPLQEPVGVLWPLRVSHCALQSETSWGCPTARCCVRCWACCLQSDWPEVLLLYP